MEDARGDAVKLEVRVKTGEPRERRASAEGLLREGADGYAEAMVLVEVRVDEGEEERSADLRRSLGIGGSESGPNRTAGGIRETLGIGKCGVGES